MRRSLWRCFCRASQESLPASEVPVVIVGGGPVGLTLSILLSRLGVRSLLVEKKPDFSSHPQAHFINNRTMEIFRRMHGIGDDIQTLQPLLDHWRKFIYCTALDGHIMGAVDHIRPEDLSSERSPTTVAHFSQHRLLPVLLDHAKRLGISVNGECGQGLPEIGSILMGYECSSVRSRSDGLNVEVRKTNSSPQAINCQYLVACDGAGSFVRKSLGISLEGESNMQQLINVHFVSRKLGQYLVQNRPGMLYFVFNPSAIAVIVAHDFRAGEFVAQIPFYPPQQKAEDFTKAACRKILSSLGADYWDTEVKAVKPWTMHAEVASKYISGHGRVLLAGDAAHRFPPAGGFGMNTGIQDAHNLAWKLAAVVQSMAPASLLETYEEERRPIALANTALSVSNFKAATSIPSALGLDPLYASKVHEVVNSSILPERLQSAVLNTAFLMGRTQVSPLFLNKYNPIAQARLSEVQKILQTGESLQLQFPSEDLFFRYYKGAVVKQESQTDLPSGDRQQKHVVSALPGVRLPHMFLRIMDEDSGVLQKEPCSTLDLVGTCRLEFLLIVGCCPSGIAWAEDGLRAANGVPLKIVIIIPEKEQGSKHLTKPLKGNKTLGVVQGDWWRLCDLPHYGAILVRPDDHVAWRSATEHGPRSLDELRNVFDTVFRQPAKCG